MKKEKKSLILVLLISLFLGGLIAGNVVVASQKGTKEEAVAMVEKAAAFLKANGKDKAFPAFNDTKGAFVKHDLYIFVLDWKGNIVSHGANNKLIGQPFIDIKDADGKLFFREIIDVAKTKNTGWVDYKWTNPVTKKVEQKSSYVKNAGDYIIVCGVYK